MAIVSTSLATHDHRPFFDKALRYGVEQGIISPERQLVIQEDFAKGIVQVAHFFGTAHLRPELELARHRMVNLISLHLEDMSEGDLSIAAASLRDKSFLSHSKAGSEMLKRLHAMPDSTVIDRTPVSAESQRAYLAEMTASDSISLADYQSGLNIRQENQRLIDFSFWLASKMGVARDAFDDADSLIRSAMLVLYVSKAERQLPTRTSFVRLIKAAKAAIAPYQEEQLNTFIKEAPTEFQSLARRAMAGFIEKDLPHIRASINTADKLLQGDAVRAFFIRENLDEEVREYDRLVAREWDRVTRGESDDPAVLATVFFFLATGCPPKATLLLREAKALIHIFRTSGFDSQGVIHFIDQHAPESIREDLRKFWQDEIKSEAEEQLADNDPDWPDAHMERALAYLKKTCHVAWKGRGR
jgi:hypothetical protein